MHQKNDIGTPSSCGSACSAMRFELAAANFRAEGVSVMPDTSTDESGAVIWGKAWSGRHAAFDVRVKSTSKVMPPATASDAAWS